MFKSHCTNCGASNQIPLNYKGKSIKCHSCGDQFIALEDGERTFKFECLACGGRIEAEEKRRGEQADCPHCKASINVTDDPQTTHEAISTSVPDATGNTISDTRKCPYCSEDIKTDAIICRFCMMDFKSGQLVAQKSTINTTRKEVRAISSISDGVNLGCGMFIVLPIIIIAIFFFIIVIFSSI